MKIKRQNSESTLGRSMSAILSATRPARSRANSARNFSYPTVLWTSFEKEEVNIEALNLEDGEEDEP